MGYAQAAPKHDTSLKGLIWASNNPDSNSAASCHNDTKLPSAQPGQPSAKYKCGAAYRSLSDAENRLVNFLESSFKTAVETNYTTDIPESLNERKKEMNDFYNVAVIWAKMMMTFIKTVDDFKQLDIDTKIHSLKSSIRCCLLLIAAYTFDTEGNMLVLQELKIGVGEFMNAFVMYKESSERLIDVILSMQDALFKDPCLIAIFELVVVFSPAWDDLVQRKCLSDLQNKYLILLKHYLEAKYSYSKGQEFLALVLQKFMAVKEITTQREEIILQMGTDKLVPFAKELFEVKKDITKKE